MRGPIGGATYRGNLREAYGRDRCICEGMAGGALGRQCAEIPTAAGRRSFRAGFNSVARADMWSERHSNKKATLVAARPFAGGLGRVGFAGVSRCCPRWLRCPSRGTHHDVSRATRESSQSGTLSMPHGSQRDDCVATRRGTQWRRRARSGEATVHRGRRRPRHHRCTGRRRRRRPPRRRRCALRRRPRVRAPLGADAVPGLPAA